MPVRPVAAVLLAGLFAINLAMAGVVAACPMWDHGTSARSATAVAASGAMSGGMQDGMQGGMQGMAMTATGGATETDEEPCDHPVSPEQCHTMAPCAAGFLPTGSVAEPQPAHVPGAVAAALVAMPMSVSSPPEIPPPRA